MKEVEKHCTQNNTHTYNIGGRLNNDDIQYFVTIANNTNKC